MDAQEAQFRKEEVLIKQQDLALKRVEMHDKRWALSIAIVAAGLAAAASIISARTAASAATCLADTKWQQELIDDHRKRLHDDVLQYVRTLGGGIDHLFIVTSGTSPLSQRQATAQSAAAAAAAAVWEAGYRAHIRLVNDAVLGLSMDNSDMAVKFDPVHRAWASIGDRVSAIVAGSATAKTRAELAQLNSQLGTIDLNAVVLESLSLLTPPENKLACRE